MADDIFVKDLRTADQLQGIPRILTYDQLKQIFKLDVSRAQGWDATSVGNACWKLVGFYVRTGAAQYIPKVVDANGNPMEKILVCRSWPGVDKYDQAITPDYSHNGKWDGGFTNANGDLGMAYGGGSVTGANGGPDRIWVSASPPGQQPQTSDCAMNLGWIGGTDHVTANPVFQYTIKQMPPGPNPDPDPDPGEPPIIVPPSDDLHVLEVAVDGVVVSTVKFKVTTTLEVI